MKIAKAGNLQKFNPAKVKVYMVCSLTSDEGPPVFRDHCVMNIGVVTDKRCDCIDFYMGVEINSQKSLLISPVRSKRCDYCTQELKTDEHIIGVLSLVVNLLYFIGSRM